MIRKSVKVKPVLTVFSYFQGVRYEHYAFKKKHGAPNWAACATTDLSAAEDFYRAVFGWEQEHCTSSTGTAYSIQRLSDKSVNSATAAGGKVLREPFDIPGVGSRMAVLQDPQGARYSRSSRAKVKLCTGC